jgi:hypothetical protein
MNTCTILIRRGTRKKLKDLGQKAQTYDDLINELIERRQGFQDRRGIYLEARRGRVRKKNTLVGRRFDPLAQQVSGDHKD